MPTAKLFPLTEMFVSVHLLYGTGLFVNAHLHYDTDDKENFPANVE